MTTSTTPAAGELLTDDEILEIYATDATNAINPYRFGQAIERALLARLGEQPVGELAAGWIAGRAETYADVYPGATPAEAYQAGAEFALRSKLLQSAAHPPAAQPVAQGERGVTPEWVRDGIADFIADHWPDRKHTLGEIEAGIRAIEIRPEVAARSAAQGAAQVPAGWRLVPVEPTEDMLDAITTCHKGRLYPQDSVYGPRAMRRREYVAMLSAAPSPAGERTSTEGDAS